MLLAPAVRFTASSQAAYTTLNPSDKGANIALSGGNLTASNSGVGVWDSVRSVSSKATGKFYIEVTLNAGTNWVVGICDSSENMSSFVGGTTHGYGLNPSSGVVFNNSGTAATYSTTTATHVICFAANIGSLLGWWRVDGGSWNAGGGADPATSTGGLSISGMGSPLFIGVGLFTTTDTLTVNFGSSAFSFTVPSGFGGWTA